jgi:hypothetical protein
MGKAAKNERLKITAAYLNNIATAFFVTGIVIPYLSLAGRPPTQGFTRGEIAFFITALFVSGMTHLAARSCLAYVKD